MQDRPTAREILDTVALLLEEEVLAATDGPLRHKVRVAANLCRILERELALGPGLEERESELLSRLLDVDPGAGHSALDLNRRLVERFRAGYDPELERRAWAVLVEVVRGKLAVAKPGHDAHRGDPSGEDPEP